MQDRERDWRAKIVGVFAPAPRDVDEHGHRSAHRFVTQEDAGADRDRFRHAPSLLFGPKSCTRHHTVEPGRRHRLHPRVDPVKADALAGDLDHVAVDHAAGPVTSARARVGRSVSTKARRSMVGSAAGRGTCLRWRWPAQCRLSLGSGPMYPQDSPKN